jgi:uroporphyrinogen III methyltransferase/synthase
MERTMKKAGKVYLVGAGPGDPGLITVKGLRLLKTCDAVIYDRLVSDRLLDQVKEGCEKIYVGKTVGSHEYQQKAINQIIIDKAFTYPMVVRLKGGDPFVFGRGGEEVIALQEQGIPYEVVPGVTSAIAAATYAGIPVTHRGYSQSFHVITGHTAVGDTDTAEALKSFAHTNGTLIVLMGLGNLAQITEELLENGKAPDTPVLVVANGTTKDQQEVRGTLAEITHKVKVAGLKAPAAIIIGKTAALDMKATISYPLSGVKVGITGTKEHTDKLTEQLEELGAQAELINPSIIYEFHDNPELKHALSSIEQYQWVVLTSTNAVRLFFKALLSLRIDQRRLKNIKFAVVGSGTEETLLQHGYRADLLPEQFTGVCLAEQLAELVNKGERILIPRARQGSESLVEILEKHHLSYDDIKIYDVISGSFRPEQWKQQILQMDYITFASASGVEGLFKEWKIDPEVLFTRTKVICIGEATEKALRSYGYDNALVASEASVKGLVGKILEDCEANRSQ